MNSFHKFIDSVIVKQIRIIAYNNTTNTLHKQQLDIQKEILATKKREATTAATAATTTTIPPPPSYFFYTARLNK